MIRRQRQLLRVEVIDGQIAVRVDDDGPRAFLDRGGVDAVAESLFDDDGVAEIAFGLRKQVADGDGFSRTGHAEQHGVLRRRGVFAAGEGLDPDEVAGRSVVNRLGRSQVPGERAGDWEDVGEETILSIELPMFVASPGPAGPRLEEQILRGAGQVAFEIHAAFIELMAFLIAPALALRPSRVLSQTRMANITWNGIVCPCISAWIFFCFFSITVSREIFFSLA